MSTTTGGARGRRKAVRVRTARWSGVCPRCRAPVLRGQLVASIDRRPWVHAAHLAARRRDEVYDQGQAGPVIAAMLAGLAQARSTRRRD